MTTDTSDQRSASAPTFDLAARDRFYWGTLQDLAASRGLTLEAVLRQWPAYAMRRDLPRFLSHYELFKQVIDLPGCIVELGVFKGASFFTWTKLMEIFCSFDRSRKVFGFDGFDGLQGFVAADGRPSAAVGKVPGGYRSDAEDVQVLVDLHNADTILPGSPRCQLVVGDVQETLPRFLEEHAGLKISLLHFDMDLYAPTKFALELLYPLVVKGGVVVFDEYGLIPWQGETRAVDEFLATLPEQPILRKHPFAHTPHGWFIK